ncbi:B12-binding domain-containing radical SAM protein [Microbulbifer epialgicus]|uniref:Radical SAM protein n=1 Tax=Microbulbifer epialgicus TaxID=393907 RepID=A0ABV4P176_9GAMM
MKILFLSPSGAPEFKLNLFRRFTEIGELVGYLSSMEGIEVEYFDAVLEGATNFEIIGKFCEKVDLVIFYTRVSDAPEVVYLAGVLKSISPKTEVFVYGDATFFIPQFFVRSEIEYVHLSGDPESAVDGVLKLHRKEVLQYPGLMAFGKPPKSSGLNVSADNWGWPALSQLPIDAYLKYYTEKKKDKPFETSFTVSRGCGTNCTYCPVPKKEGVKDRRRSIDQVISWIERTKHFAGMVKLHTPDIAGDPGWMSDFSEAIASMKSAPQWRSIAILNNLTTDLIDSIKGSGCWMIGFGLETMSLNRKLGPKGEQSHLIRCLKAMLDNKIIPEAFLMIGYPGQKDKDIRYMISLLRDYNVVIRPTGFTPFYRLRNLSVTELESLDLRRWDKRTFYDEKSARHISKDLFYRAILRDWDYVLSSAHQVEDQEIPTEREVLWMPAN